LPPVSLKRETAHKRLARALGTPPALQRWKTSRGRRDDRHLLGSQAALRTGRFGDKLGDHKLGDGPEQDRRRVTFFNYGFAKITVTRPSCSAGERRRGY